MSDLSTCTILYHVLTPVAFNALMTAPPTSPLLDPSSSSLSVCTSSRLAHVLQTVFLAETNLWVLAIPRTERIDAQTSWIDEEGCARVEGGVDPWGEVALRRRVQKGADGQWDLGELEW